MRILVATGSSGGHIFPALAFLDSFRQAEGFNHLLVLPAKSRGLSIDLSGYNFKSVDIESISLRPDKKNLISLFKLLKGFLQSLVLIIEFHPDTVVGFGGIATVPIVFWAWIFRKNILIHEQNVKPGKSTRFLSKLADKIAVSFPQTIGFFPEGKSVLTGNPVREKLLRAEKNRAFDFFGFQDSKTTLLVMGGSQGSESVNQAVIKAFAAVSAKKDLQVIHLTGGKDQVGIYERYKELDIIARVYPFLDNMGDAYVVSDLVISRAGAATIQELINFKVPAILIPYPYAHSHQLENANVLKEKGCAIVIEEPDVILGDLANRMAYFINNPAGLKKMKENFSQFIRQDSAGEILKAVMDMERHNE